MAKKEDAFDEKAFLQAMSEGHAYGDSKPAPSAPPAAAPSVPPSERKRKPQTSDYEVTFLHPQEPIKQRSFIGLRPELYEVIVTIVKRIGEGVSAQAFVENVLRHHLTEYQSEINRLNREKLKKDIL